MEPNPTTEIQTFVAFDVEASGFQKTKITEIAFVSALRSHILDTPKYELPRVIDKINLCVYPNKLIQLEASNVSGLTNELLSQHQPFDSGVFNILESYLNRLPQPVCIIAHNGNSFDFPILQSEVSNINKVMPDHLLCVDSLEAFREILKPKSSPPCDTALLNDDEFDNLLCDHLEAAESFVQAKNLPSTFHIQGFVPDFKVTSEMLSPTKTLNAQQIQTWNETTPKRNGVNNVKNQKPKKQPYSKNVDITPVKECVGNTRQIRKKLVFPKKPENVPNSFKLQDVYKFVTKKEVKNNHRAENDAMFLMECIVTLGSEFIDWADRRAIKFNQIKRRW